MGCANSRVEYEEERNMVIKEEANLGFSSMKSSEIHMCFHRFSISLRLSVSQLQAAARDLKLNMKGFGPSDSPITKLYNHFKNPDMYYNTRKLCALGVLLGDGRIKEKAKILFKNYDTEISNTLDINEIQVLLDDILTIALVILPSYALSLNANHPGRIQLVKYNEKLAGILPTFYSFYEIILIKDVNTQITLDQFVDMFGTNEIAALASATALRELAIREHAKVIAPVSLVKDYILESKKTERRKTNSNIDISPKRLT